MEKRNNPARQRVTVRVETLPDQSAEAAAWRLFGLSFLAVCSLKVITLLVG